MTKIVIAKTHSGFGLSDEAMQEYLNAKNIPFEKERDVALGNQRIFNYYLEDTTNFIWEDEFPRNDPDLVRIVEELGKKAWGDSHNILKVVEIPDGVNWELKDYDGIEWIAEIHRTWT